MPFKYATDNSFIESFKSFHNDSKTKTFSIGIWLIPRSLAFRIHTFVRRSFLWTRSDFFYICVQSPNTNKLRKHLQILSSFTTCQTTYNRHRFLGDYLLALTSTKWHLFTVSMHEVMFRYGIALDYSLIQMFVHCI